jgi:6-phosphofructokinase 1
MQLQDLDFTIEKLGECRIPSPIRNVDFVPDHASVSFSANVEEITALLQGGGPLPALEQAGPREKIFFEPSHLNCGIVACGGICPGLNDVIRAVVLCLHYQYGVKKVYGLRYGYEGLVERSAHPPLDLTPKTVNTIHSMGGTILGSSRGEQDIGEMVDFLQKWQISILFTIGGDGTLRGAKALAEEIRRRGLPISVIGIPKTIDNDIVCTDRSFGFETAASEACRIIDGAHNEATSARNGIGLVKLMGRDSGFIAAFATLASGDVNYCLVPESPFTLEGLLLDLEQRLAERGHAVIVVAEGAGQNLFQNPRVKDASGNLLYHDIGLLLRDEIKAHFKKLGIELNLKYIDPSYIIRSLPATPHDSAFCLLLAQEAVHAGMSGRTNLMIAYWRSTFAHVPLRLAASQRKKIDPKSALWRSVRFTTGQPSLLG